MATPQQPAGTSSQQGKPVPTGAVVAVLATAVALTVLDAYTLVAVWPASPSSGAAAPKAASIAYLGTHFQLSPDAEVFVIAAAAGALGGMIHVLRSLAWYIGNRYLRLSWLPFYLLLPIVGAALGTVFYLVARAGLFSPTSSATADTNVYGVAALAGLVGLFSEQALQKLRDVFSSLFAQAPQGADTAPPNRRE